MNRLLIPSDHITIRSDEYSGSVSRSSAQTPARPSTPPTPDRATAARLADRDIQALWPAELPLCRRAGTRSEAISGDQSARRSTPQRLCPERFAPACCEFDWQLQQAARCTQRDLCDQHGTPAPAREPRIDRDGPSPLHLRYRKGGRSARRHGCLLSCCWRLTIRSGERQ